MMSALPSLRSIVYASQATAPMDAAGLEELLTSARTQNIQNDITGVLLCSGEQFFQCFEGPDAAVQETYDRIRNSRRHSDLIVYMDTAVSERTFDHWAMGCAVPVDSELITLATAEWTAANAKLTFSPNSPPGLGLLKFFWDMRQTEL